MLEQPKNSWNKKSTKTKVLTVLMYLICIYFVFAGFLNIPPASYLSDLYGVLTQTNEYYPALHILLLTTPTIIMFRTYDTDIS